MALVAGLRKRMAQVVENLKFEHLCYQCRLIELQVPLLHALDLKRSSLHTSTPANWHSAHVVCSNSSAAAVVKEMSLQDCS